MKYISLLALLTAGLWAHDARLHQANATTGDVTSVRDGSFDLKTAKGTVKVTYDAKTKFEHGGKAADKDHLAKGAHVGVIGTKLASGQLVAKEILLGVEQEGKDSHKAADHKH
jgi:hypothetical protein